MYRVDVDSDTVVWVLRNLINIHLNIFKDSFTVMQEVQS